MSRNGTKIFVYTVLQKEEGLRFQDAYCWNMQESGAAKALRQLVPAAFANCGYRIKLQEDVFFLYCHPGLSSGVAFFPFNNYIIY